MSAPQVWDMGLQPERTRLAWQRTSLSLLTSGLVVARFVGHHHTAAGVLIAAATCVLAGALGITSTRRYRTVTRHLHEQQPLHHGVVNLLTSLTFVVVAIGALIFVVLS